MFKEIKKLKNFFLDKKLIFFLFLFFSLSKINYLLAIDKIYLDLLNIKYENEDNFKKYETSTQILVDTDLEKDLHNWVKENIVLKGNSGELTVKIIEESIIDSFVEEHRKKFNIFLSKDSIAYKINFKVKIIAENKKNNSRSEVLSIIKGEKTFLGGFSINERSEAVDELMNNMIKRLSVNLRQGVQKEFKDFFTNKYN